MFTDCAGRQWLRTSDGVLSELAKYENASFEEDAGAFESIEAHPTLHLPEDEYTAGGRIID
jgi:hypothetical protein